MKNVIYTFVIPFPYKNALELLKKTILETGKIKKSEDERGYILSKYKVSSVRTVPLEFFIERGQTACKVRACFKAELVINAQDKLWDNFLQTLFRLAPETDFGVSLANKNPYVVGVLYLGNDTEEVHISRTTGNRSLTGFLLGGALFGDAGAIVGGMTGTQKTYGRTYTQFSNKQLARLLYNNGRLWEGEISKGSKLYNEIMVNM